jgi:Fur family ferric uptake transcriptional regulator
MRTTYKTRPKQLLMTYLRSVKGTATVEDIHQALPEIDVSTIYRNLEKMAEEGEVLRFPDELGKKACYQAAMETCENHLHLKCLKCGRVIHLDCDSMQEFVDHLRERHGFTLSYGTTVLYGICKDCQKKEDENNQ